MLNSFVLTVGMTKLIDKLKEVTFTAMDSDTNTELVLHSCIYDVENQTVNGWKDRKPVTLENVDLVEWEAKYCMD